VNQMYECPPKAADTGMQSNGKANRAQTQEGAEDQRALQPDCFAVLENCFGRIRSWRVPPNWLARDWFDEIKAHGVAASYQAIRDFDPKRGVPLGAFVYQRVIARVLTRHRQEWTYALHVVSGYPENVVGADSPSRGEWGHHVPTAATAPWQAYEALRDIIASLPEPHQWLIKQLFWHERTEEDIARALGIGRRAVNKRKHAILHSLREALKASAVRQE
jgi:DNA-directed RNA polymerase specialized sigma24 family protein